MTDWLEEIQELHDVFEAHFRGEIDSLSRVESALAADFTIVSPRGDEATRDETLQALQAAHARLDDIRIWITEPRVIIDTDDVVVASYVENQQVGDQVTHRLSTVIFRREEQAPLGLSWHRVHETWLPGGRSSGASPDR